MLPQPLKQVRAPKTDGRPGPLPRILHVGNPPANAPTLQRPLRHLEQLRRLLGRQDIVELCHARSTSSSARQSLEEIKPSRTPSHYDPAAGPASSRPPPCDQESWQLEPNQRRPLPPALTIEKGHRRFSAVRVAPAAREHLAGASGGGR